MNGQLVQPNPASPAIIPKSSSNLFGKALIGTSLLLLGFSLGFFSSSLWPNGKQTTQTNQLVEVTNPSPSPLKPVIDESKLPISFALLTNPIVYEWRGGVKGKVTQKDGGNFILTDEQGNSITITNKMPSGDIFKTLFFDKNKKISLQEIPLGTILLGDFFIFKDGPNTPVGSAFVKQ